MDLFVGLEKEHSGLADRVLAFCSLQTQKTMRSVCRRWQGIVEKRAYLRAFMLVRTDFKGRKVTRDGGYMIMEDWALGPTLAALADHPMVRSQEIPRLSVRKQTLGVNSGLRHWSCCVTPLRLYWCTLHEKDLLDLPQGLQSLKIEKCRFAEAAPLQFGANFRGKLIHFVRCPALQEIHLGLVKKHFSQLWIYDCPRLSQEQLEHLFGADRVFFGEDIEINKVRIKVDFVIHL